MANMSLKKNPMPSQEPDVRNKNFDEVALGYTEEMAIDEAKRCLNCKNPKCVNGCPVNVHIPEFIAKVAEGKFDEAFGVITSTNSLPAICGRVCPQENQCEGQCIRGIKGEPVGIGRLERFVADYHNAHGHQGGAPAVPESNGHKVAVVGSGPAGLTCAGDLARKGYDVTVFEALHQVGGVLVYGIPEFRLPKAIVAKEVARLEHFGVKIMTDTVVGRTITVDELIRLGSDVRTAGMLSGKAGFVCLHMGGDDRALSPVFEALERTSIPVKTFQPTHVGRAKKLQEDAFKLAKMGGTIDFTCGQFEEKIKELAASLRAAKEAGVPMDKVTISSDGQGSWSNYDVAGNLTEMGVSSVDTMYRQVVYQVQNENMSLEEALSLGTRNVAKALEVYPKKGAVHVGSDADVLVLNGDLSTNTVIARGSLMMQDGVLLKKGTYEA